MSSKASSYSLVQPYYTLTLKMNLRVVKVGVLGLDVSKDRLTIYYKGSTRDLPNDEKGFQERLNRELHDALAGKLTVYSLAVWYYNRPFDYFPCG